jgi:hypothetical protein
MLRIDISILAGTLALACTPEPELEPLVEVGDGCEQSSECESGLCQHLVCVDNPDGPYLVVNSPEDLEAFDSGLASVSFWFSIGPDTPEARVMVTIDPGRVGETTAVFDSLVNGFPTETSDVLIPAGLSDGPHQVLTQVIDASGEPYPNPHATDLRTIFVRDAEIPSTPQVAIHWPLPGHEYLAGQPIEIEVAVLPGSFTFSSVGESCRPLDDCTPAFSQACEESCGQVSRSGSAVLYVEEDFPACLADEPIGCELAFRGLLSPGSPEASLLDGYLIRGTIPLEPGEHTLTAALSYSGECSIYPNKASAMYDQITISVR